MIKNGRVLNWWGGGGEIKQSESGRKTILLKQGDHVRKGWTEMVELNIKQCRIELQYKTISIAGFRYRRNQ